MRAIFDRLRRRHGFPVAHEGELDPQKPAEASSSSERQFSLALG
jgi:hypothetical protein